jgi:hypothetical protein
MKIGRGVFVFDLYLFDSSRRLAFFLRSELNRLRNEILSGDLFKYLSAFEVIDPKVSADDIIGLFFVFVVSTGILCQKEGILQREFASFGNVKDLLMVLGMYFQGINNGPGDDKHRDQYFDQSKGRFQDISLQ